MKQKLQTMPFLLTCLILTQLILAPLVNAGGGHGHGSHHDEGHHEEEHEKGPNNGRMLRDGEFAIELAIFENGLPAEFRVFPSYEHHAISANEVDVSIELIRLGDGEDKINFTAEETYLRGDVSIREPHSFTVVVSASYAGKKYHWSYDSFEGRTSISDDMAKKMGIKTESVGSQMFSESLKVYGELTLAPSALRHISARFPGEVKALYTELGKRVSEGQKLLTIESNESLQTYHIYSPINGVITKQSVGTGEQTANNVLLIIADDSELIAELAVFPMDQSKVKLGSPVFIKAQGLEEKIETKLVDSVFKLTTAQAKLYRAKVDNSKNNLTVGQFVSAKIELAKFEVESAVKAEALQAFRDFTVVYAKVGEQYEVRMLELGRKSGPWVELISGIDKGTEYVSKNSYIIKADIEKAGAAHDH